MPTIPRHILALDVGNRRVGVAIASSEAQLASPLTTLEQGENLMNKLTQIIKDEAVTDIVVGWPRNQSGEPTEQTQTVEKFSDQLKVIGLPIYFQDESLTSKKAEAELEGRGKPYKKSDIDALAATYILEDWLAENKGKS